MAKIGKIIRIIEFPKKPARPKRFKGIPLKVPVKKPVEVERVGV